VWRGNFGFQEFYFAILDLPAVSSISNSQLYTGTQDDKLWLPGILFRNPLPVSSKSNRRLYTGMLWLPGILFRNPLPVSSISNSRLYTGTQDDNLVSQWKQP